MITGLTAENKRQFENYVTQLKEAALINRKDFLSKKLMSLRSRSPFKFVEAVLAYYKEFAFFNDDEIKKRFEAFGFKPPQLRWLSSIDTLTGYFDSLEKENGIIVIRDEAFRIINLYTGTKINQEVIAWASEKFPDSSGARLKNFSRNLPRMLSYELKDDAKFVRAHSALLRETYNQGAKLVGNRSEFDTLLKKISKGNIQAFVIGLLLERGFVPLPIKKGNSRWSHVTESEYLWRLSGLIKYVMKDKHFYDEAAETGRIKKQTYGLRLDTVRSIRKIVKGHFHYAIPKGISQLVATQLAT